MNEVKAPAVEHKKTASIELSILDISILENALSLYKQYFQCEYKYTSTKKIDDTRKKIHNLLNKF